jgi:hypothetical protein
MRIRAWFPFSSDGNKFIDNLRPDGTLWWKRETAG